MRMKAVRSLREMTIIIISTETRQRVKKVFKSRNGAPLYIGFFVILCLNIQKCVIIFWLKSLAYQENLISTKKE
jgi:hypothetical protein